MKRIGTLEEELFWIQIDFVRAFGVEEARYYLDSNVFNSVAVTPIFQRSTKKFNQICACQILVCRGWSLVRWSDVESCYMSTSRVKIYHCYISHGGNCSEYFSDEINKNWVSFNCEILGKVSSQN